MDEIQAVGSSRSSRDAFACVCECADEPIGLILHKPRLVLTIASTRRVSQVRASCDNPQDVSQYGKESAAVQKRARFKRHHTTTQEAEEVAPADMLYVPGGHQVHSKAPAVLNNPGVH